MPKLSIASAGDLFTALRSDALGVRLSVFSAISKAPEKALAYGPYNGRDLLDEMFEQLTAARDHNHRLALLVALSAFKDPRVEEGLKVVFRTSTHAREAAVCAARLCGGSGSEVKAFFLPFLEDNAPQPQARLAADVLSRFDDHSPENRVRVAVLSSEVFPIPGLDDQTEAAWLKALHGPFSHRAMGQIETLGCEAFVRLRERWDEFMPELKAWLLKWGCREHQAHAVELCLKALDEGPDELRLAALQGIAGMGPAAVMFRKIVTKFFDHTDRAMRLAALRAGADVPDARGKLSREEDMEVRLLLIPLLAVSYGAGAVPDLVELLHDENWRIRSAAVAALISLGEAAAGAVENLAGYDSATVCAAAVQVLRGIGKLTA